MGFDIKMPKHSSYLLTQFVPLMQINKILEIWDAPKYQQSIFAEVGVEISAVAQHRKSIQLNFAQRWEAYWQFVNVKMHCGASPVVMFGLYISLEVLGRSEGSKT